MVRHHRDEYPSPCHLISTELLPFDGLFCSLECAETVTYMMKQTANFELPEHGTVEATVPQFTSQRVFRAVKVCLWMFPDSP